MPLLVEGQTLQYIPQNFKHFVDSRLVLQVRVHFAAPFGQYSIYYLAIYRH